MGHDRLYEIMKEKDMSTWKKIFKDEDGIRAAELEGEFAELEWLGSWTSSCCFTSRFRAF